MGATRQALAAASAVMALPFAAAALAARSDWRVGLGERLGAVPTCDPGRLWIHAASAGEVLAALGLARALERAGRPIYASAATRTGRDLWRERLAEAPSALAPLDHPWCVDAALARVRPSALALVETELWPIWIAALKRRGAPVAVVSGRLSDRSLPRYRGAARWLRSTFARLDAVGARSDLDAARFASLGVPEARIEVTGDLKLAGSAASEPLAPDLARVLGGTPLLVAGSTHEGEERAAVEALAACETASCPAALVVAPRHLARADEVERELRSGGRTVRRRSTLGGEPLAAGEVLLLDSMGELAAVYGRAVLAFVGGSLVAVGGHNLVEPVQAGVPVVFGARVEAVREAALLLESCGAGERVVDAAGLARAAVAAVAEPAAARRRAEAGRVALEPHRASLERTLRLIDRVVPAAVACG